MIESLIPAPRKLETNVTYLDAPPEVVWDYVRHADLAQSSLVRALFKLRTLPSKFLGGSAEEKPRITIDEMRSTPEQPGFQVLADDPPHQLVVGAIGKVWQLDIPFLHVDGPEAYARVAEPGWVKVAWTIRLDPWGKAATRFVFEVRVDATDQDSWGKFTRYWAVIGPGSHFIRHAFLAELRRRFGSLGEHEEERRLVGDELLPDAGGEVTRGVTIQATPEAIWPWLMQMGCHRGGFYAIDVLDNGGVPSAREIHPDLQVLRVGDVIPATPQGADGFEVLAIEPTKSLILGGLFDIEAGKQLPFGAQLPKKYWQTTWAFVLEPLDAATTRLHVRARAAFSPSEWLHVAWIRPVHALMQSSQLRNLAARAEGRLPRDTVRDIGEGVVGASVMLLAWLTPFLRSTRNHWGLTSAEAAEVRPGDELVAEPVWSWTHAVEVQARAEDVWPWIAQIGADRAGFYSYQWLENLVGCGVRNAESVHTKWVHELGDSLVLHPEMPSLRVTSVTPGRSLVAFAEPDANARALGKPWAAASWAFLIEPLGDERCRVVSRFRSACSEDLATRLLQGPTFLEPIGFAMDRRMLLGIRDRVLNEKSKVLRG